MPFFQDPLAILAVLMLNIIIAEQLAKLPYFRPLGTALIVIIITAITANLSLIPASTNATPLYEGIFTYLAPLSIFYLLLTVNLKGIKRAGSPMVINFLIGAVGTMVGVIVAMRIVGGPTGFGPFFFAVGGMFAATHTGGE